MQSARFSHSFPPTGRFTFRRRLGAGAFGVVYEADDHERATRVALKTLHHLDAAALYRFKHEFRALADVVHPNLVTLHELVSEGDEWFFTMDLVEGTDFFTFLHGEQARDDMPTRSASPGVLLASSSTTLTRTLTVSTALATSMEVRAVSAGDTHAPAPRRTPSSPSAPAVVDLQRFRSTFRQLGEGLVALHAAGKLHRDLKPSNVLVTAEGRVVILDFGLVVDLAPRSAVQSGKHIAGTPAYMAPEQARGETPSPAGDWYAVGVMLYEALTGRRPFEGTSHEMLTRKQREEAAPPSTVAKGIPEDLDVLCSELLRTLPLERPSGAEVLRRLAPAKDAADEAPPADVAMAPFMGRESHLSALRDAFARAAAGRATTVHVRGVSGMGKSMLVRRFLDELHSRDAAVVLEGRCYEREAVPYKAVDSLIDALSRHLSGLPRVQAAALLPRDMRAIVRLFPVLDRVEVIAAAPRPEAPLPDAQELRRRGFAALRELLTRMAALRPLVLHIDDLQWGDADSAALLVDLLREPDPPGLLLVIGYRSEDAEKSELLRKLPAPSPRPGNQGNQRNPHRDDAVRELTVGPLEPSAALALALHVLGSGVEAGVRAEAVVAEAAGSPFFVCELARAAKQRPSEPASEIRLSTVLGNRLSGLSAEARCLLEVIAVAGRPLLRGVARQASALSPEQERTAMSLLRAERVLRARGAGEDEELETFHDRIRETIVARLGAKELVAQHLGIGAALEASGTAEPEVLARHFLAGGRRDKAHGHALRAAERAASALAFDRAASLYDLALQVEDGGPEARRALTLKRADALVDGGRCIEAAPHYLSSAEGAARAEALHLRRRAAEQFLVGGQIEQGIGVLRRALAEGGLRYPSTPRRALAGMLLGFGRLALRGTQFRECSPGQVPERDRLRVELAMSATRGLAASDMIRGAYFGVEALLLALDAGDPHPIARALTGVGLMMVYDGSARGVKMGMGLIDEAQRLASGLGDPALVASIEISIAIAHQTACRWRAAVAAVDLPVRLLAERSAGYVHERNYGGMTAILSLEYLGHLDEAVRRAHESLGHAEAAGNLYGRVQASIYVALGRIAGDDPRGAAELVQSAMALWPSESFLFQHWLALKTATYAELHAGEARAALDRVTGQWPALKASGLLRLQFLRIFAHQLRAGAALAVAAENAGEQQRLLASAERDARQLEREGKPVAAAAAALVRAGAAALRRRPEAALGHLETAIRGYEGADMALYAVAARRRKGQIVGGAAGEALIASADAAMAREGIKDGERWTSVYAPGFG